MALVIKDRVKETTTTTGTGTFNLAGAVSGFEGFIQVGDGNTTYYVCTDNTDFEIGIGTFTDASPDTLSRDTILQSSNSDNKVDWSAGTRTIFCTYPADKAVFEDASNNINGTFVGNITGNVTGNTSGTAATVTTAAQTNITSLGTLTALTVDDVAIDGKVITMTGSSGDTATITAGTNGTLDIATTDGGGAAGNIQITADGTAELAGTTVTLDSSGGITLDADGGTITFADAGSSLGTITSSGYTGNVVGNVSGTAATVTGAAQTNITSVGTLSSLTTSGDITVGDDLTVNGGVIDLKTNSGSVAQLKFYCESANAHAQTLQAQPHARAASNALTLPGGNIIGDSDATLLSDTGTQTVTNKSIDSDNNTITNIVNADIKSSAAIADSKLATISTAGKVAISALDIDGGTDIGAALADADEIIVDDGGGGTNRRSDMSRVKTYVADVTLTTAAQTNITSLGTLTGANISGDVDISGGTTTAAITASGVVDITNTTDSTDATGDTGALRVEGGASIAKKLFVGTDADIDGTLEADAITVGGTALNTVIAGVTVTNATTASVATTVTITDNESTNEDNAIIFTAGGDVDGGNIGLESDGNLTYNPSTGRLTATQLAGTLQTAAQSNITSLGTLTGLTVDGDVTLTGADYNVVWDKSDNALEFGDNAKATFGASGDLEIKHNGNNSFITDTGTGSLYIQGATSIFLRSGNGVHTYLQATKNGSVDLYHNNSKKFETTSAGATVTGVVTADGFTIGSAVIAEAELEILDGATVTTAELNILDGVTSTAAELNILDGVTATASELNIMDGVTATTAELNYSDGVTSAIQTQLDAKATKGFATAMAIAL